MRRLRHVEEHENHERWLISYADFITLLFAFFVVLFASTYRDNQSIRKLAKAIHNGFQTMGAFSADESGYGGPYASLTSNLDNDNSRVRNTEINHNPASAASEANMLELKKQLEAAMGKELANHEMVLQLTPQGFTISLKELGFFNSGQAELLPGAGEKIIRIAKVLDKPGLEIRVEGHSDNQPIHSAQFNSNWELSASRAMNVLFLLVHQGGFDPSQISAAAYGQYRPVADNSTADGRRMNRRVDLVVMEARPHPLLHH
jgi:chemotaxis protein MotB